MDPMVLEREKFRVAGEETGRGRDWVVGRSWSFGARI